MIGAEQALAVLRDYVERSTHWREGGATRHDALTALSALRPIGSIHSGHLKAQEGPWCKEILLYSPDNQGDRPETRSMVYGAKIIASDGCVVPDDSPELAGWERVNVKLLALAP